MAHFTNDQRVTIINTAYKYIDELTKITGQGQTYNQLSDNYAGTWFVSFMTGGCHNKPESWTPNSNRFGLPDWPQTVI